MMKNILLVYFYLVLLVFNLTESTMLEEALEGKSLRYNEAKGYYCEFASIDEINKKENRVHIDKNCVEKNEEISIIRGGQILKPFYGHSNGKNGMQLKCDELDNVINCTAGRLTYSRCSYNSPGQPGIKYKECKVYGPPFNITAHWSNGDISLDHGDPSASETLSRDDFIKIGVGVSVIAILLVILVVYLIKKRKSEKEQDQEYGEGPLEMDQVNGDRIDGNANEKNYVYQNVNGSEFQNDPGSNRPLLPNGHMPDNRAKEMAFTDLGNPSGSDGQFDEPNEQSTDKELEMYDKEFSKNLSNVSLMGTSPALGDGIEKNEQSNTDESRKEKFIY